MAEWRRLTEQEQKLHPLYGVKNWLAVFGIAVVGRGALTISEIAKAAQARGVELSNLLFQKDPVAEFLRNALLVDGAVVAVILYAMFARARSFRLVSSVALVASIPALLAIGFASGNTQIAEAMGTQLVPSLLSTTAWCLYLNLSRRVRVTFESTDRDDGTPKRLTITSTAGPEVIRTEALYAKHAEQFDTPARDHGLYTRLLIELNGNESAARLAYIKSKVERESPSQHVGPPPPESSETRVRQEPNSMADLSKPFEYRKNHWETIGVVLLIFAVGGVVINALSPPHQARVQDGPQTTPELQQESSLPVEPQDPVPDIPAEVEAEFNRRFPEWSSPERRALLQAKINEIDQRTDKEGKPRFSDAVVMELARIELVREGN